MLIDSHCHLNDPKLLDDVEGIVTRAEDAGVGLMQTICCRKDAFEGILDLTQRFKNVYASFGIHPHEAGKEGCTYEDIIEAAQHKKVIGIGETGLDYHYDYAPRPAQQESFVMHSDAARALDMPLIIHSREAEEDTIDIVQDALRKGSKKILFHCFTSNRTLAEFAWEERIFMSASGIVTFKKSADLQEIFTETPMETLLIETDSPYLAPTPYRGKTNEPAYVKHVAEKMAELKSVSFAELAQATTENFYRLFDRVPR